MDVLFGLGLGVNQLALPGVFLGVLEDGALEAARGSLVFEQVVGELAGHDFFDLVDRGNSLGAVSSSSAVVEAHGVGCIFVLDDLLRTGLLNGHF